MFRIYMQLQKFVDHIVKQGHCASANDKLRLNHFVWLVLISLPLAFVFTIKNLLAGNYYNALFVSLLLFCMQISLFIIPSVKKTENIYSVNNLIFICMLAVISVKGTIGEGQILWCYTYPLLCTFLFGHQKGFYWSLALLCLIIFAHHFTHADLAYSVDFKIRFAVTYLTTLCIAFSLEYYRSRYSHRFTAQKEALEHEREILKKEIRKRAELELRLKDLANNDGLTELLNRRSFWLRASSEITRSKRYKYSLSLAIIDIDKFKKVNDTFGHPVGDDVLRYFAKFCKNSIRNSDTAGRIGGEEFAILLPHTSGEQALILMNRLRIAIGEHTFNAGSDKEFQVTISVGISSVDDKIADIDQLYKFADNALYKAKSQGRNQVKIAYNN